MLDDADNYLSRGWCTLEALVADNLRGATDLIVGSERPSTAGEVEGYFQTLLEDRPHVLWRAILDTEIFGIQSPTVCMQRLGLAFTNPNDLSFIYKRFSTFPAPLKVHIDESEIITGAFPLPSFNAGTVVLCARSGMHVLHKEAPSTITLDWTQALFLVPAWNPEKDSAVAVPPFRRVSESLIVGTTTGGVAASIQRFLRVPKSPIVGTPSCHVAVIGACEGEAILFANWAERNKKDLESLLSVSVTSISWTASDIAPIGHMTLGTLETVPVLADAWVIVAMSERMQHCRVTTIITESLRWSGVRYATLAIDFVEDNVKLWKHEEPPEGVTLKDLIVAVNLETNPPRTHIGGLFRWQIPEGLL
jgi:hypothetical protein